MDLQADKKAPGREVDRNVRAAARWEQPAGNHRFPAWQAAEAAIGDAPQVKTACKTVCEHSFTVFSKFSEARAKTDRQTDRRADSKRVSGRLSKRVSQKCGHEYENTVVRKGNRGKVERRGRKSYGKNQ
jgi:hypothetical protein